MVYGGDCKSPEFLKIAKFLRETNTADQATRKRDVPRIRWAGLGCNKSEYKSEYQPIISLNRVDKIVLWAIGNSGAISSLNLGLAFKRPNNTTYDDAFSVVLG